MEPWLENFARANFRRSADTAHDLKTPLNVAVLNLELLRMRLKKLAGDDEKVDAYTKAIELELRRLGTIFDAFFLLSTPPKNDEQPADVDVAAIVAEVAGIASDAPAILRAHESRIRQAVKLFMESAPKFVRETDRRVSVRRDATTFSIEVTGKPEIAGVELTKIFKFYYSDSQGNADLSLAVARLIAETYGGEVNAVEDRDTVSLRFILPLGER